VKPAFRISGVVVLIAIYCFALAIATTGSRTSAHSYTDSSNNNYFSVASSGLFNHTAPTDSAAGSFNYASLPVFKNPFGVLLAVVCDHEFILAAEFDSYKLFETGLLVNTRKANHIFPFHYFW